MKYAVNWRKSTLTMIRNLLIVRDSLLRTVLVQVLTRQIQWGCLGLEVWVGTINC